MRHRSIPALKSAPNPDAPAGDTHSDELLASAQQDEEDVVITGYTADSNQPSLADQHDEERGVESFTTPEGLLVTEVEEEDARWAIMC